MLQNSAKMRFNRHHLILAELTELKLDCDAARRSNGTTLANVQWHGATLPRRHKANLGQRFRFRAQLQFQPSIYGRPFQSMGNQLATCAFSSGRCVCRWPQKAACAGLPPSFARGQNHRPSCAPVADDSKNAKELLRVVRNNFRLYSPRSRPQKQRCRALT